jgi:hypothetical protein
MAKPPPPPKVTRSRGVPVQVYLSKSERRALQRICRKREETVADVLRRWIWRSMQESGLAKKRKQAKAAQPETDPRQLDISAAIGE